MNDKWKRTLLSGISVVALSQQQWIVGPAFGQQGVTIIQNGQQNSSSNPTYFDASSVSNLIAAINAGSTTYGAGFPGSIIGFGGLAKSSSPSAATTGAIIAPLLDLTGKSVTSPYAIRENMVRGNASTAGTTAVTLIPAAGASIKNYITDIECGRIDSGTTPVYVSFSDSATTVLILPPNGGNNKSFSVPLVTSANSTFSFSMSTTISTVFCNAQGFVGY